MKTLSCLAFLSVVAVAGAMPAIEPVDLSGIVSNGSSFDNSGTVGAPSLSDSAKLAGSDQTWTDALEFLAALGLVWLTVEDFTQWDNVSAGHLASASGGAPGGGAEPIPESPPFVILGVGLAGLCVRRRLRVGR